MFIFSVSVLVKIFITSSQICSSDNAIALSANKNTLYNKKLNSLMSMINKSEPRMESRGTPVSILIRLNLALIIVVNRPKFDNKKSVLLLHHRR